MPSTMRFASRGSRPVGRRHLGAALALGAALSSGAALVGIAPAPAAASTVPAVSAGSDPVAGHSYRHGAVPLHRLAGVSGADRAPGPDAAARGTVRAAGSIGVKGLVSYGGGSPGLPGVITASPAVYLVFWGSQWGTESTDGAGYDVFSGDPDGLAPDLEAVFDGLGTDNEQWSAIVTQYCQGVGEGATSCPLLPLSEHVAYPSATVLRGVWEDTSVTLSAATGAQIAEEAAAAAVHFGDPAEAQYVIVSAHGTDPDGWLDPRTGYCAYHDNSGDPSFGSITPDVPYTNMPYVPDVHDTQDGDLCSSFTNPGPLDGANETISHEYDETLTDPYPSTGWTDRRGDEVADKCENLRGGTPGGSQYVTLSTGTFALQGIWANDDGRKGGCETAHPFVLTTNPGKQSGTVGTPVSLAVAGTDVRGASLTFSATGLPAGLAIGSSSGVVTGTPTARRRSIVTVTLSDGSSSAAVSFVWVIRR